MKVRVKDVMSPDAKFCRPDDNVAQAVAIMWNAGCGALPVLDPSDRLCGMITDRDIAIALGTRNLRAADVRVADVAPPRYFGCRAGDDIHTALRTMTAQEVRRLPVVDEKGHLAGMLSIDAIILHAKAGSAINYPEVISTLQAICAHREHKEAELATIA
jgi:CBS domain-containing protein